MVSPSVAPSCAATPVRTGHNRCTSGDPALDTSKGHSVQPRWAPGSGGSPSVSEQSRNVQGGLAKGRREVRLDAVWLQNLHAWSSASKTPSAVQASRQLIALTTLPSAACNSLTQVQGSPHPPAHCNCFRESLATGCKMEVTKVEIDVSQAAEV